MIFGQVMAIFKVNPDPDPNFLFLCEHGAWCIIWVKAGNINSDISITSTAKIRGTSILTKSIAVQKRDFKCFI